MRRIAAVIAIYVGAVLIAYGSPSWNVVILTVPDFVPGCGCGGVHVGDVLGLGLITLGVIFLWRSSHPL